MARYLEGGAGFIQQHISFFTRKGSFLLAVSSGGEERSLCVCVPWQDIVLPRRGGSRALSKETPRNAEKMEF